MEDTNYADYFKDIDEDAEDKIINCLLKEGKKLEKLNNSSLKSNYLNDTDNISIVNKFFSNRYIENKLYVKIKVQIFKIYHNNKEQLFLQLFDEKIKEDRLITTVAVFKEFFFGLLDNNVDDYLTTRRKRKKETQFWDIKKLDISELDIDFNHTISYKDIEYLSKLLPGINEKIFPLSILNENTIIQGLSPKIIDNKYILINFGKYYNANEKKIIELNKNSNMQLDDNIEITDDGIKIDTTKFKASNRFIFYHDLSKNKLLFSDYLIKSENNYKYKTGPNKGSYFNYKSYMEFENKTYKMFVYIDDIFSKLDNFHNIVILATFTGTLTHTTNHLKPFLLDRHLHPRIEDEVIIN